MYQQRPMHFEIVETPAQVKARESPMKLPSQSIPYAGATNGTKQKQHSSQ
jgi:hypothetical protein